MPDLSDVRLVIKEISPAYRCEEDSVRPLARFQSTVWQGCARSIRSRATNQGVFKVEVDVFGISGFSEDLGCDGRNLWANAVSS